jgi:DNA-binding CsgD family transcriptional regulator
VPLLQSDDRGVVPRTMGAAGFAGRARRQHGSVGVGVPRAANAVPPLLTEQQQRVAVLTVGGARNVKIAAQPCISANAVDYHLRGVFKKLSVTSRRQIVKQLDDAEQGVHE